MGNVMYWWWEVTTVAGYSFAVKGAGDWFCWCGHTGKSAKQAADEIMDERRPGDRISSYFRMHAVEFPSYPGVRKKDRDRGRARA